MEYVRINGVTLGVLNTGKNDAQLLVLKLDNQTDFDLLGYNSYIMGNLNKGDDTSVDVLVTPKNNQAKNTPYLKVQLDYTDKLGYRRAVNKIVPIKITPEIKSKFDEIYLKVNLESKENGKNESMYKYLFFIMVMVFLVYAYFNKRRRK